MTEFQASASSHTRARAREPKFRPAIRARPRKAPARSALEPTQSGSNATQWRPDACPIRARARRLSGGAHLAQVAVPVIKKL